MVLRTSTETFTSAREATRFLDGLVVGVGALGVVRSPEPPFRSLLAQTARLSLELTTSVAGGGLEVRFVAAAAPAR